MAALLTYALDEGGALVHVDDVLKGDACNCFCPHCKAALCAKNGGELRDHHFAHTHGHECEGAFETSLHLLAKDILEETGRIMLPDSDDESKPCGLVRLHNIEIEKYDNTFGFKPDAEGTLDDGRRLLIEFYVSHKVSKKKRDIIIANNLLCIEIDINYQELNRNELRKFLTSSVEDRKWVMPVATPPCGNGDSFSYGRNPIYDKTRDMIKEKFDMDTILIDPLNEAYHNPKAPYDLRKLGYDVCEVGRKQWGFKSDLLLYRSQKEDKAYISINFRGRRRSEGFKYPKRLRIMDVIIGSSYSFDSLSNRFEKGEIIDSSGMSVISTNFAKGSN